MPTKEELELQAKANQAEQERLRKAQAVPGGPVSAFQDAARTIFNPAARGVQPKEPQPTAPASPTLTDQEKFLEAAGVNDQARAQDPKVFNENPALRGQVVRGEQSSLPYRTQPAYQQLQNMIPGNSQVAMAGREMLAGSQYTNLGSYGTQGGPNIYGRSSKMGGPLDTFVGVGTPNKDQPTTQVNGASAQVGGPGISGNGVGQGSALYNNADPYNLSGQSQQAPSLRQTEMRAGQRQFGGGAGGGGGLRMNEIRRINQQANNAFNRALEGGMNTKAALRIADSIRAGAGNLTAQDRNDASRYGSDRALEGTQYSSDTQALTEGMRQAGYDRRSEEANQAKLAQTMIESRDATFKNNVEMARNMFINPETGEPDDAAFSRVFFAAGGEETFKGLNGTQFNKAMKGAEVMANRLDQVNAYLASQGVNRRYDNLGDFFAGTNLIRDPKTGNMKLGKREFTMGDAMSGKIGWSQIWDEGLQLGDGTLVPTEIWEAAGPMTNEERQSLEIIIPEDR